MAVTLRDIAKALNLSHATVSFVLNDRRDVAIPETTRQRVIAMAREMGYRPNRAARALVMGRTQMVAIWQPTPSTDYYGMVFDHLYELLHARGYETMYCRATGSHDESKTLEWPVDGVIGVDTWAFPADGRNAPTMPYVSIGPHCDRRTDHIQIDVGSGAYDAVQHLIAQGCRGIVHLTSEGRRDNAHGKLAAYNRAMHEAGLTGRVLTLADSATREEILEALRSEDAKEPIDGIFAFDDDLAMAAYGALSQLGRCVPQDVAVVGFNDLPAALCFPSPISTVRLPMAEACEKAVEHLHAKIKSPNVERMHLTLNTELVVRESSLRKR